MANQYVVCVDDIDVEETDVAQFDFSKFGIAISFARVEVVISQGVDADPTDILNGPFFLSMDQMSVYQPIKGATDQVTYEIRVIAHIGNFDYPLAMCLRTVTLGMSAACPC